MSSNQNFSLSKMYIERLKTIAQISKKIILKRDVFINGETSSIVRTTFKDIPDDFSFRMVNINSFLSTYLSFSKSVIDYSELESKKYIKICNAENVNNYYIFRQTDPLVVKIENEISIDMEDKFEKKKGSVYNKIILTKENIKNILNSGKVVNPDMIYWYVENNIPFVKLYDSKNTSSCNYSVLDLNHKDIEINEPDLFFDMNYANITAINEAGVDYYTMYIYKDADKNSSRIITFVNNMEDCKISFTRSTLVKR